MTEERVLKVYPTHSLTELHDVPMQMFNDIARAQLQIRQNPERTAELGSLATHFRLVENPAEADIHLLPLLWNWYLESSHMGMVGKAADQGKQWGKPVVLFSAGDYTANVPFSGLTIFQPCAYRSRRFENGNRVFALPAFISDFVKLYCDGQLPLRQKGPRPVVGFCGLAGGGLHRYAYRLLKLQFDWLAYRMGIRKWEPPPFEPTLFRRHVLEQLRRSPDIACNFILRDRYRAGYHAPKKDPFHPTRMEYVQNMLESDYIVCMRGGGNFSVRFYEALSMGRIPVFVDTDSILPYEHIINYRRFCIWVEQENVSRAIERIAEFHALGSEEQFCAIQHESRRTWVEYLSRDGFYAHFYKHFRGCQ